VPTQGRPYGSKERDFPLGMGFIAQIFGLTAQKAAWMVARFVSFVPSW